MIKALSTAAAVCVLALSWASAQAAPMQAASGGVAAADSSAIPVHGYHRDCRRGPRGWHRNNKFGERRACRQWQGGGKRPDFCVKVGNFFYCDY